MTGLTGMRLRYEHVFRHVDGRQLRTALQRRHPFVGLGHQSLEDDRLQLRTVVHAAVADAHHRAGYGEHTQAGVAESVPAEEADGPGQREAPQAHAVAEGVAADVGQAGEVLQLVEGGDVWAASEHLAQLRHGSSLLVAQLAVVVGIPMGHTQTLHRIVLEVNDFVAQHPQLAVHLRGVALYQRGLLLQVAHLPAHHAHDDGHQGHGGGNHQPAEALAAAPQGLQECVHVLPAVVDGG